MNLHIALVSPPSERRTLKYSFLDLFGSVSPSFFELFNKRFSQSPEESAHLPRVSGGPAGFPPHRAGAEDPIRRVPARDLSLGQRVGGDLSRPPYNAGFSQLLDDPRVIEERE